MTGLMSSAPGGLQAPELLAPAGNWECAKAAVENGADAIYFGLQVGFNARARADNFTTDDLPELMRFLHRRGVRGYVTLNTLVFTDELPELAKNVAFLAEAGVDAVLVQDLGAVRLIRQVAPELEIHASTQMTMVSAETIAAIESLGISRVVLARELSLAEIAAITSATSMPVETFVHGALCVAYSGQCLTSESLGGRSANRGQCAQACRLNYTLYSDGQRVDLGANQYLLSPQDLSGYDYIPKLIEARVASLKIEGRLKTPEYVANTVSQYRRGIDAAMAGMHQPIDRESKRDLEMSFSRGLSPGWLEGCNHKRLVPGLSSAKRGVKVGEVIQVRGDRVSVSLEFPLSKGDGVVFEGDRAKGEEFGGRVYTIFRRGEPQEEPMAGEVELQFQRGWIQKAELYPGQSIWQTDDPRLSRRLRASFQNESPQYQRPIAISVDCQVGEPMHVTATILSGRNAGQSISFTSDSPLEAARKHPLTEEILREQFSRLGNSPFYLDQFAAKISGRAGQLPMIPLSQLGKLRRHLLEELERLSLVVVSKSNGDGLQVSSSAVESQSWSQRLVDLKQKVDEATPTVQLRVLCRTLKQVEQVSAEGIQEIYADFHDIREYRRAVAMAHAQNAKLWVATLRIQKPGEMGLFRALEKHGADGWLVRNLAAMRYAVERGIRVVGDFSLNVTNPLTAEWLMEQGLERVTASYDLNRDQLNELVQHLPPNWMEIVIHQHMPMFHMEHCVFCTVLSPGTNKSNCGRPCDRHAVELADRIGVKHVLHADIGCRNTLYNGVAQSGAEAVASLLQQGISQFRIELLNDTSQSEVAKLLRLYRDLIHGKLSGSEVWKTLKADNRVGVTRGTMEQTRNPLAIL